MSHGLSHDILGGWLYFLDQIDSMDKSESKADSIMRRLLDIPRYLLPIVIRRPVITSDATRRVLVDHVRYTINVSLAPTSVSYGSKQSKQHHQTRLSLARADTKPILGHPPQDKERKKHDSPH